MAQIEDLLNQASEIRNADQEKENTAQRVGKMLMDIIQHIAGFVSVEGLQAVLADYAPLQGALVHWRNSRVVCLASMGSELDNIDGGDWQYTNHAGDIVFNPSGRNLSIVGEQGNYSVFPGVFYVNLHSRHCYVWDATTQAMIEITDSSRPTIIDYRNNPPFAQVAIGESYYFESGSAKKIAIKTSSSGSYSFDPDPKKIYVFKDTCESMIWNATTRSWISIGKNIEIVDNLTEGGRDKSLSAEMGKELARMISNAGSSRVLEQRVAIIAEILQNAVFTSDQSQRFEDLAALEDAVDSITLNVSSHTFNGIGGTFTLVATTVPSGKAVRWKSDNPTVAFVDNNGEVTALTEGHAIITAEAGSNKVTASCAIHVQEFQIDSLALDQSSLTSTNERWHTTHQLRATATADGQPVQVEVIWRSTNPAVTTVDNNGLVTIQGNSNGQQCRIEATAGGITASCEVTVTGMVRTSYSIVKNLENASVSPNDANVLEGEDLDFTITADANHEFTSDTDVTVKMNSVDQHVEILANRKSARCVINNVSGNIAIVATATFVETNLMDTATPIEGGSVEGTQVVIKTGTDTAKYSCKRVKLEKGKYYKIKNFRSNNNCNGFDALLQKDDGNGGYTPLLPADLVDSSNGLWVKLNNTLFSTSTGGYRRAFGLGNSFTYTDFVLSTPPADELQSGVGDIYLVIDTMYNSDAVDSNFGLYEWRPKTTLDFTDILPMWRANVNFLFGFSYGCATIFMLEKGATYHFLDYNALATANQNIFSLLRGNGNEFAYLKSTDFKSGSTWLTGQNFFVAGGGGLNNIGKNTVGTSGSFTVPTDNDVDGDLYLTVALSTTIGDTDSVAGTLTITKSQS